MWEIGTDEEFRVAVERMSALCSENFGFKLTRAAKDHTDLFDQPIRKGDDHYTRGGGFGDCLRLSKASMDRVCVAVLFDNRFLTSLADKVREQRQKAYDDAMRKIWEQDE